MNFNNILHNINIIGLIQPGDKLNIIKYNTNFIFKICSPKWYQSLIRIYNNDSRNKTCLYLNTLILFELNNLLKDTLDKDSLDLLKSALEKANTGIYNLRQTYNYIYEINMTLLCLNIRILSIIDDLSKRNLSYISFNI